MKVWTHAHAYEYFYFMHIVESCIYECAIESMWILLHIWHVAMIFTYDALVIK